MDERCEVCGRPGVTVTGWAWDGQSWVRAIVHIACENSKMAKMRRAGMMGMN